MTVRRPHPYFDDHGALDWHTSWESALAEARATGKRVFVEYGREQCSQCRALVQSVLPQPGVAELLARHFVALAADCDSAEPPVDELAMKLEHATQLPFVLFASPEGDFVEGFSGAVDTERMRRVLERLVPASPTDA